jgi:hypothetical protein
MSAAELRQAAEALRGLASEVPPSDWWEYGLDGRKMRNDGDWIVDSNKRLIAGNIGSYSDSTAKAIATYIATMQPSVALALADLLDTVEGALAAGGNPNAQVAVHALAVARLINGGAA